jgi:hypothetical protein
MNDRCFFDRMAEPELFRRFCDVDRKLIRYVPATPFGGGGS